jgi:hypothetical protein
MMEGKTNAISAPTLEEFTDDDFMEMWERSTKPQPTISIEPKTFSNYVKMDQESKRNSHQYT